MEEIADVLKKGLQSGQVDDRKPEANVVDGLFAIARAINRLADAVNNSSDYQS
jgi:hypothetical protein